MAMWTFGGDCCESAQISRLREKCVLFGRSRVAEGLVWVLVFLVRLCSVCNNDTIDTLKGSCNPHPFPKTMAVLDTVMSLKPSQGIVA